MNTFTSDVNRDEHLLDEFAAEALLVQASQGMRFTNYLIDRILLYLFERFVSAHLFAVMLEAMDVYIENRYMAAVVWYVLNSIVGIMYYMVFEYASGGKTVGKLITGTRAVKGDGRALDFRTALIRSLCRAVPFDVFSALGKPSYPWHDKWSGTCVIEERKSSLPVL